MIDKKQLHEIIQDLIEVVGEKNLKVSNDIILEQACSYQRGLMASQSKSKSPVSSQSSASSGKKESEITKKAEQPYFNITPRKLAEWKLIPPTPATLSKLKKIGYSDNDLKYIKTQYDAHIAITNLQKENI